MKCTNKDCPGRAEWNVDKQIYICPECGLEQMPKPVKRRCFCGHEYTEITWFIPSGCPKCNRSFVD